MLTFDEIAFLQIFSCLSLIFWISFTLVFWTIRIRIRISILNEDLDPDPGNNIMQIQCGFGSETLILCWAKLVDNDTNCTVLYRYCTGHYSITLSMKVKFYILLIYCNEKFFFVWSHFLGIVEREKTARTLKFKNFWNFGTPYCTTLLSLVEPCNIQSILLFTFWYRIGK
jgi:hypothetical protein